MKQLGILLVVLLGLMAGFSCVGQAGEPEILYTGGTFDAGGATFRLGNWGGFWKEQWMEKFIPEFEKDFNCKVSYDGGWPWFPKYVAGGEKNPPHAVSNWNLFQMSKAANAGGLATSGVEMSQNSLRLSWTREEVDEKLHNIMINIHKAAFEAAETYGTPGNYVNGANIAGFLKVANAMMDQGVV